ncbi:hypothetical protein OSB04_021663 [Centaurea solstitialis]|uniref:Uncharacterized protein n=1 Tax=Centaurea solstitialis TaxID=347529 RepID=A0AA38SUL2_9ASTR|nr:hypothetical protein OSB04_021663 [Centaurea solstitialis]
MFVKNCSTSKKAIMIVYKAVGKLIYLSHTWPDISFAVWMVSAYMNRPIKDHQYVVLRILQYLKQSQGKGIFFSKTSKR